VVGCLTCNGLEALCDRCLADAEAKIIGCAMLRGERWGESVARRMGTKRAPWPSWERTKRLRAIAISKVSDVTRDQRLRERLARVCAEWAGRSYTRKRVG
jgi:hypothetical protein